MQQLAALMAQNPWLATAADKPAGAALALLALQLVWQAAPDKLDHIQLVRHMNGVLLIAALTRLATSFIEGLAKVREGLLTFLARNDPQSLPRVRMDQAEPA